MAKGTDLSIYHQEDLGEISNQINDTGRGLFNWESAAQHYDRALVATTG